MFYRCRSCDVHGQGWECWSCGGEDLAPGNLGSWGGCHVHTDSRRVANCNGRPIEFEEPLERLF